MGQSQSLQQQLSRLRTPDGRERTAIIVAPATPPPTHGRTLVLFLHGAGGSAFNVMSSTRWAQLAVQDNFVAVFPNGTACDETRPENFLRNPQTWNSEQGFIISSGGISERRRRRGVSRSPRVTRFIHHCHQPAASVCCGPLQRRMHGLSLRSLSPRSHRVRRRSRRPSSPRPRVPPLPRLAHLCQRRPGSLCAACWRRCRSKGTRCNDSDATAAFECCGMGSGERYSRRGNNPAR